MTVQPKSIQPLRKPRRGQTDGNNQVWMNYCMSEISGLRIMQAASTQTEPKISMHKC